MKKNPDDTKEVFKKCGACSHTFYYILNREFGHPKDIEETASDPLAGGLMLGQQCGMLWGSSLAAGAESYRRNKDAGHASCVAIASTRQIMESFKERAGSVNCRDITGADLRKKSGMALLILKILLHGGLKNSICFRLADKWAPEAIQSATAGLSGNTVNLSQTPVSCASELVKRMSGTEEDQVTVAGFAGGMGLKGHACGALAAAIWMNTLLWCKNHPGEVPPNYNKKNTGFIMEAFNSSTQSEILCTKISGQSFNSVEDHAAYLNNGGCDQLLNALAVSGSKYANS
jgi:hypothetical protein